jgi:hypothetical protein
LKRFVAILMLFVAITSAVPMYGTPSKHKVNPEAKAAQKRNRARAKALKKAAKRAQKRNHQLVGH